MKAGAKVTARVDRAPRSDPPGALGHAHPALRPAEAPRQARPAEGSKVEDDWLRFDFGNSSPVDADKLAAIEHEVAERIAAAEPIQWKFVPLAEARAAGAMMLFGEKYPDPRPHGQRWASSAANCAAARTWTNTGEVRALEIVGEEGVAAGTRRITALTGAKAIEHLRKNEPALGRNGESLGVGIADVPDRHETSRPLRSRPEKSHRQRRQAARGAAAVRQSHKAKPRCSRRKSKPRCATRLACSTSRRSTRRSVWPRCTPRLQTFKRQLASRAAAGEFVGRYPACPSRER